MQEVKNKRRSAAAPLILPVPPARAMFRAEKTSYGELETMHYILGFITWTVLGLVLGFIVRTVYKVQGTDLWLSLVFGFFGAFIGGMLGSSGYVHHDPNPFRFGGILGAALGASLFSFIYSFTTDKAV
jgi:uncharacterized membrane protein YeaQ/YmgE (transglycosylase-associated protein family)